MSGHLGPWAAESIVLIRPGCKAAGHWQAINPGVTGSITVTDGTSDVQVRAVRSPDLLVSQADSCYFQACAMIRNIHGTIVAMEVSARVFGQVTSTDSPDRGGSLRSRESAGTLGLRWARGRRPLRSVFMR
jgi:hypothetical protein